MTTRRELLAGGAVLAAATAAGALARTAASHYDRAIVIDGLGAVDDPVADGNPDTFVFSPQAVAQIRASGTTAWQVTVGDVGNDATNWDNSLANIGFWDRLIAANPVLTAGRSAADIRAAKAAGKAAIVFGTQDTAMAGTISTGSTRWPASACGSSS